MKLSQCFILAAIFSYPITSGRLPLVIASQSEVLFLHTLSQKTDHGIATLDTKNNWIKFESVDDDIVVTVDVKRARDIEDDGGLSKVIYSRAYRLNSAKDTFSHILPNKAAKGTTVCLESYGRDLSHYSYVFSY